MYVRKFEADTIDDALKAIKRELGPDAIILKTISNRGIKSAFKKSKFEITAAIREENYLQKAKVDKVLNDTQKNDFYRSPAKDISKMINQYEKPNKPKSQYGNLGLNKSVKSKNNENLNTKDGSSLDDFLKFDDNKTSSTKNTSAFDRFFEEENQTQEPVEYIQKNNNTNQDGLISQLNMQENQIHNLERKILELSQSLLINNNKKEEKNYALTELIDFLRSFNIKESFISKIVKKAQFELKEDEIKDENILYEFALREFTSSIHTELPLFSSLNLKEDMAITVLLNETSSGQSATAMKLAVLQEDVDILVYGSKVNDQSFSQNLFGIRSIMVSSLAEIISACRKAEKENRSIIIDVKDSSQNDSSARSLIDSLNRTFKNIEVLVTCSALHSEVFNGKILSKYKSIANGVIITHVDMCLDFGAIINVHISNPELPLKFFGTGSVIPEDIEAATSERIVASLFKL